MPVLGRLATLMLMLTLLASCGEGYSIKSARLNLIDATPESHRELQAVTSAHLAKEGFEDLGRHEEMIALLERNSGRETSSDEYVEQLRRKHTYFNRHRRLTVEITDHSDGSGMGFRSDYTPSTRNFVEIAVYEARPGGASPEGHEFYRRLQGELGAQFGDAIVEINGLPANDEAEYRRVTRANQIAMVRAWCIAFFLTFLLTSSVTRFVLGRTRLSLPSRRLIFTVTNVWLATPVLLPAATILVLPLPNALAFPWLHPEIYLRGGLFNLISLMFSLAICAAAAMIIIKAPPTSSPP